MATSSDKLLEQLFLLEVVIDKLALRNKCDHSPHCTCKWTPYDESIPLRIRIKFINFPCFEIEQEYFSKEIDHVKGVSIVENFSSGKSCLFPMAPLDLIRAMRLYPLAVTVYQRKKEDAPAKVLGAARVPLSQEMIDAVRKVTYCDEELPINTNLLGSFPLTGPGGKDVGRVHVFLRLSCFGQSIVTQFQLVDEFQSFLFKNSRADTAFTCKRCTGRINIPCPPYKDVSPLKAMMCDENGNQAQEVRDSSYAQCPFDPKVLVQLCECDVHREPTSTDPVLPKEEPYCRGCEVNFAPETMGPCEKIFIAEDVRAADITAAHFEVQKPSETTLVVTQTCKECCETAPKDCCGAATVPEGEPKATLEEPEEPPPPQQESAAAQEQPPAESEEDEEPLPPREWFQFGKDIFYSEPILVIHPPIRYDTTSCLSNAWGDHTELLPHPAIRYDTTSSLTDAFQDIQRYMWPPNPLVRYDTTSCLSPAFEGAMPPVAILARNPPVRYDNTGCLSSAYNHPPVRYDNTGKLSLAYINDEPPNDLYLIPLFPTTRAPRSIHLLEYTPLMSYDVGPDWTMLELHDLVKKRAPKKSCASPTRKRRPLRICPPKITPLPTVRRGHKRCLDVQFRVPSRMGWLWNTSIVGLPYRPGWCPGAILRAVSLRIQSLHKALGVDVVGGALKKRRLRSPDEGQREAPPTLVLARRDGKYHLSVRPPAEGSGRGLDPSHYAPSRADPAAADARPYSVDLSVSTSSSSSSGISSSASSVCPPCACDVASDDDTDSLKIEFVAPANFQPRWKFPSMEHEATEITAEDMAAARRAYMRIKKRPQTTQSDKGKKSKDKGAKDKGGKGKENKEKKKKK